MKDRQRKTAIFLGVVARDGSIFIPWRGTNVSLVHDFEPGQDLLVELDITAGMGKVIKAELPTLEQLKKMKDELWSDWWRLAEIFRTAPMKRKVLMLQALDNAMRSSNW